MPLFSIDTNVPKEKVPADFVKVATATLAKTLNKPEEYVCVHLKAGQDHMSFGGTTDPCAYALLMSIGELGPEKNKRHSAVLFKLFQEKLGIPPERIFIQFTDAKPTEVGWNGSTFEGLALDQWFEMPIFLLWTNISKIPPGFFQKTTKLLAAMTNKTEDRIMCIANHAQPMTYGGSDAPTAYMTFSSIGVLNPEANKKFSATICDYVSEELDIKKDRILIKFQDIQGSDVGWNGTTRA